MPTAISVEDAVWHEPYVQLGDAPLPGFPGAARDRIEIMWQTRSSATEEFGVRYRATGAARWQEVEVTAVAIGRDDRVTHRAVITGLEWDTRYEYEVTHHRDGADFTFDGTWRTRLAPGDRTPFSFAAYGDSACGCDLTGFEIVQAAIARSDAGFALLLGDNVYQEGTFEEVDARFGPERSQEAAAWRAEHLDLVAYGNHDVAADGGVASESVFSVPVPVVGVSAPASPPPTEPDGHNYSFDHGAVHFVTFDSNALRDPDRLDGLVDWLEADLVASRAQWKIVFAHHPVAGAPDKSEGPEDPYYRTLVPALNRAGADLLLVGHSHTFGWTFPLRDEAVVESSAARSTSDFVEGDGVVQVISGVGGRSLRAGSFDRFGFVAAGFSLDTEPRADWGYALVDVTSDALTVSYVVAHDDSVRGSFTIHRRRVALGGRRLLAPIIT